MTVPTRARERLLTAAEELFYAEGVRAVGVDRILDVSGVGRASFYRHFTSKDELVVAVLRQRDESWRRWLADEVAARGGDPLAVFDALAQRITRADFRGCAFINTIVEAADPDSAAHQVADEHKRAVVDYLTGLLGGRRALAEQFGLLVDGAIVTALRTRTAEPAHRARAVAETLLRAAGADRVTDRAPGGRP